MKNIFKISILVLAAMQTGCLFRGTGTGNPFNMSTGLVTNTQLIAEDTCVTVLRCHTDAELNACRNGIGPLPTFTARFGVQMIDSEWSLIEVAEQEAAGVLVPNATGVDTCRTAIRSVDCSTPEAVAAYNPAAANPYAEAAGVLGDSCLDVFEKK